MPCCRTRCDGYFELTFLIRTAGDFSFEDLFCLHISGIVTAIEKESRAWFSEMLIVKNTWLKLLATSC